MSREESSLEGSALYYDYGSAASPIFQHLIEPIAIDTFSGELHRSGPTRIIPLDLSESLKCAGPATSPGLCASFVRVVTGEDIDTFANATSQLFYVMRGRGRSESGDTILDWGPGDFMTLPAACAARHRADDDAALYWIHDEPLLRYLGVTATERRFVPTVYRHQRCEEKLEQIKADPVASKANRLSVLLANSEFPQTRTITQALWAMYGAIPANVVQYPHRHEAVALDLVIDCPAGCYTMIGSELDDTGMVKNGVRADWSPGSVFVTPPGLWHSHHNESDVEARVLPIQDAGLHTFLRTLEIEYSHLGETGEAYVSPEP